MKVKNTSTGEISSFSVIDSKSGCNWIGDLIGNYDAYGKVDGGFFEAETDDDGYDTVYLALPETIEWWEGVISSIEKADALRDLCEEAGLLDGLRDELDSCGSTDLEFIAPAQIEIMEKALASFE